METTLIAARLVLAAIFITSGVAKLLDRAGARQGVVDFGVPTRLARPIAALLPFAELALAAGLLLNATVWPTSIGSLALLGVFTIAIAANLALGRRPDCNCFGQLTSGGGISGRTLVRNAVFIALAAIVAVFGARSSGPEPLASIADLVVAQPLAFAALAVAATVAFVGSRAFAQLLAQNGRLLLRMEALERAVQAVSPQAVVPAPRAPQVGLPVGVRAPSFRLPGVNGETQTLEALRARELPVLLVFSDPGCGPCTALMPDIGRWQREHADKLTIAVVSQGTREANRAKAAEHGVANVLLQQKREIAEAYGASGTPSAVLLKPDGTTASALAQGSVQISTLVQDATGAAPGAVQQHTHAPAAPRPGARAPEVRLPDLDGRTVELASYLGKRVLVAFWNPDCGFCQQMLGELRALEAAPPTDMPSLLIVSAGTAEANRALGLRATIVLDQSFTTGFAFGATGTPSAVLVDERGHVGSDVAVGAPAVLALARAGQPAAAPVSTP